MNTYRTLLAILCGAALAARSPAAGPTDRLDAAWDEIGYMNFRGTSDTFRDARKRAEPGSPAWLEASLGYALSLQHRAPDVRSDKEEAAAIYDELLSRTDGNPLQPLILLLRARLEDQIDYYGDVVRPEAARAYYEKLIADWPDSPLVHRAALYRAQLDVFRMTPEAAERGIREMRAWLEAHPANPLASLQWMLIGHAAMYPVEEPARALEAFLAAERVGLPKHTQLDTFFWLVAQLAREAGRPAVSARFLRRIIVEQPRSNFAYEAQQRLLEMGEEAPPLTDPFAEGEETARAEAAQ